MLADNIDIVKRNIEMAGGKNITVIAATKTIDASIISSLPSMGIFIAGENRVQELLSKYDKVSGISWHFIGRLQRNKVKYIVDKVDMIHSVDDFALADEIDKQCGKIKKRMPVLVEVNIGGEESKGGVNESEVFSLCEYVSKKQWLILKGLMSVLPKDAPETMYDKLNSLFNEVKEKFTGADILSAGMSGDYYKAIKHGANMVRLGTCLFGQRIYTKVD